MDGKGWGETDEVGYQARNSSEVVGLRRSMDSSKFFVGDEVDRIPLEDDNWVDLKRKLTIGDQDVLAQRLFDVEMVGLNREERRKLQKGSDGGGQMRARYMHSTVALLHVAIVDWSFTNGTGEKIPLNEQSLRRLDPEVANFLYEEIDKRNPLGKRPTSL